MTWTLLQALNVAGGPVTSSPVSTTGADLIIVGVSDFSGGSTPVDNQSNTYTLITSIATSRQTVKLFYCHNPTTNASHTFTANGAAGWMDVQVWSGSHSGTTLDQSGNAKSGALGSTTVTTPSETPTQSNELIVSYFSQDDPSETSYTLNNGFTISTFGAETAGARFGSCFGYLKQGAAAAISCTLTRQNAGTNSAGQDGALIATFIGAASGTNNTLPLAGGTYTLTGSALTPSVSMPLAGGTYSLTGSSLVLNTGLPLGSGTYSLTGSSMTPGVSMPLSGGSYTLTGSAMTPGASMPLGSGSYTLTGSAITLTHTGVTNNNLSLNSGTYSLSGSAINFTYQTSQPTVGGRQIDPDELMVASHKWHQRQLENEYNNISAVAAELGSLGGHARAKVLSAKHRTAIATKAAIARWK